VPVGVTPTDSGNGADRIGVDDGNDVNDVTVDGNAPGNKDENGMRDTGAVEIAGIDDMAGSGGGGNRPRWLATLCSALMYCKVCER